MRISDWSSDVCSSDLLGQLAHIGARRGVVVIGGDRLDPRQLVAGRALERDDVVRLQRRDLGVEAIDHADQGVAPGNWPFHALRIATSLSAILSGCAEKLPAAIACRKRETRAASTGAHEGG